MIVREFVAMSTPWWLTAASASALVDAEGFVRDVEARLSRFRPDSALSRLNAHRQVEDAMLAEVVREALALRIGTHGAFDPTMGLALLSAGYERSFEQLGDRVVPDIRPDVRPVVVTDGDRVFLCGPGSLDLGGITKGWTVDRLAERLGEVFLVDGGGDLRGGGPEPWAIGLEGGRAVALSNAAVATSSNRRRRWSTPFGDAHHILSPSTGRPSTGPATAVVVAPSAAVADAFATAMVADPARAAPGLADYDAQALIETDHWWMTPGMERWLT